MSSNENKSKNLKEKIIELNEKILKYYNENTFKLFLFIICLIFFYSIIEDALSLIYILLTFLLLIGIDYEDYQKLKSKTNNLSLIIGIVLIFSGLLLDSLANIFIGTNTDPTFGSTDLIPLLFGIIILLYGINNLKKFVVPLGIAISFIGITFLTTTSFGQKLHDPFATFTTSASIKIINALGYKAHSVGNTITLISPKYGIDRVVVSRGCSGFESTIYYSIIGGFLLLKIDAEAWKKIFIVIFGAFGCFFVNILRVTILCLVYFWKGMGMLETFHSNLGNLMFIIWIGVVWWIAFKYFLIEDDKINQKNRKQ